MWRVRLVSKGSRLEHMVGSVIRNDVDDQGENHLTPAYRQLAQAIAETTTRFHTQEYVQPTSPQLSWWRVGTRRRAKGKHWWNRDQEVGSIDHHVHFIKKI